MVSVFSAKELRELGFTDAGIRDALECCLERVRRGRFVLRRSCSQVGHEPLRLVHEASATEHPRTYGDIRDDTERLKILIRSHADDLPRDAVFSHISAAVIHGLDPPFPATDVAEAIRRGFHRSKPTIRIRERALPADDASAVADLPVTTILRTLLDIAHDYSLETSVPIISTALRRGDASIEDLSSGIVRGRRGCRDAVQALKLADERHESPGESLCAVKFFRFGITGMQPQVDTFDEAGAWLARNDFRHERLPVIAEFHGVGKYYLSEKGPDRASIENHERHMRLLNAGFRVFNLVWADLFRAREFKRISAEIANLGG